MEIPPPEQEGRFLVKPSFREGFLMKEVEILAEVERLPKDKLYSLGGTGFAFLAEGESFGFKPSSVSLEGLVREIDGNLFVNRPVSSMVFQLEDGQWKNMSAFVEIEGFDEITLEALTEPKSVSLRFLDVDEELHELSGVSKMVEIGFREGEGRIVMKRILLPEAYTEMVDEFLNEPMIFVGSKMSEVFVEGWDLLNVGEMDEEWNEKVRSHLLENNRDMSKRIEYWMEEDKKFLEWDGEVMWAGLLYDESGIEGFLMEEANLALLKPGEAIVTYYAHGSGAMSAATEGEMPEKDQVADVQIMGKNGKIYQGAVEGKSGEIGDLVDGLLREMREENGLSLEMGRVVESWSVEPKMLPLVFGGVVGMGEASLPVSLATVVPEIEKVNTDKVVAQEIGSLPTVTVETMAVVPEEAMDWTGLETNGVGVVDWVLPDFDNSAEETEGTSFSFDNSGGDDEPDNPEVPDSPGGLSLDFNKDETVLESTSFVNVTNSFSDFEMGGEVEVSEVVKTVSRSEELSEEVVVFESETDDVPISSWKDYANEQAMEEVQEAEVVTEIGGEIGDEVEIPWWEMTVKEVGVEHIPIVDASDVVMENIDWSMTIPALKMVNVGFDQKNVVLVRVAGLVLFVIMDTFSPLIPVMVPMKNDAVLFNRGSGREQLREVGLAS